MLNRGTVYFSDTVLYRGASSHLIHLVHDIKAASCLDLSKVTFYYNNEVVTKKGHMY